VIVEREHERGGVDRVEPERLTVEQHEDDVGERAGTETAADGEMHDVTQPPALPLVVVEIRRNRGKAVAGAAAAAAGCADEDLAARARDVHEAAVGANNEVAASRGHDGSRTIRAAMRTANSPWAR